MELNTLGRGLVVVGLLILLAGGVLIVAGRIPWLGHLPGDIVFERGGLTVFIPLTTMALVSILLTLLLNLVARLFH
jgi:uncharacterized membrane protein